MNELDYALLLRLITTTDLFNIFPNSFCCHYLWSSPWYQKTRVFRHMNLICLLSSNSKSHGRALVGCAEIITPCCTHYKVCPSKIIIVVEVEHNLLVMQKHTMHTSFHPARNSQQSRQYDTSIYTNLKTLYMLHSLRWPPLDPESPPTEFCTTDAIS